MVTPHPIWSQLRSLCDSVPVSADKQSLVDSLTAEVPGLSTAVRQELRQQLLAIMSSLQRISTIVQSAGVDSASKLSPAAAKPSKIPYMT